jgi:hypothetical protein
MRTLFLALSTALPLATFACGAAIAPGQQVLERARDMNTATRFGRLDLASQSAAPEARAAFLERRRSWGADIRVLDVDVEGVNMKDNDHAEVRVVVGWTRMSDGLLHNTTLNQVWNNASGAKWALASESTTGDWGLFGEGPSEDAEVAPERPHDVHFATRSLGAIR